MRQAWHIFKKDLRGLRREVALLVTLSAALGWAESRMPDPSWVELIAALVANYAIARVIHFEAIPGTNQFWITRPYRWKSLLSAKLMFILICIQLPMLLAQIFMIAAGQFRFTESLPGLIWSQLLILLCAVIPVACLASLTGGLVSFLFSELLLLAIGFIGEELVGARAQAGPQAVEWVRNSLAAVVIAGFAATVLFLQYRNRRTGPNRLWGATGVAAASAGFLFTPWIGALSVQTGLSEQNFNGSALSASLESVKKSIFPIRGHDQIGESEVAFPIAMRGVPAGMETEADALLATLTAPDGKIWNSRLLPAFVRPGDPGITLVNADIGVEPAFFLAESTRPVTLRVSLYLTLFGNPKSLTIPIQQEPVNVMDGLQCAEGVFIQFNCRSIFRWPRRRVYAATHSGSSESSVTTISYSPFPAELGFGAPEQHSFSVPYATSDVTITTKEPLSHFRADFTIPNVVLAEFTEEAKSKTEFHVTGER
jgi:hypothetical protein